MGEGKTAKPLLPLAVRQGISQAISASQRRFFTSRLLLAVVTAAVLYCLAVSASSWTTPQQTVNNIIIADVEKQRVAAPAVAEPPPPPHPSPTPAKTTTNAPFNPATTMKAETGPHQLHFRQPPKSVVVVRRGGDIQLNCRLEVKPHAIVTWYKGNDEFLTMGRRTYVDDERISAFVDEKGLNWALRIRSVMMTDAGTYSCHLALATQDIITVELDVLPMEDDITPMPPKLASKIVDLFVPGFLTTPDVCPNDGADIEMVVAIASHPLYVTSRDRVRRTWAALGDTKHRALVFGMGDINAAIGEKVKTEAKQNNDVMYGKFRDISIEPYTEGIKRLALLKWVIEHCRFADFTLIVTHNEFVNPLVLKKLVSKLNPEESAVYGLTDGNRTVVRDPNHPHYLSYTSYQPSQLPEYVRQPAFLVSRAAIGPLAEAVLDMHAIPQYNLLITGLAAEKANVKRHHMPELYKEAQRIEGCDFEKFAVGGSWGEPLDKKVTEKIASGKSCKNNK